MLAAMEKPRIPTAFLLTPFSASVFYELGMAEAMGQQPILVAPDARHLPFDKAHCRCHMYGGKRLTTRNLRTRLVKAIVETPADGERPH